jgi:hypothetical protein
MSVKETHMTFHSQRIMRMIFATAMLISLAPASAGEPDDHIVKIHLDPSTVVGKIPEDFLGLGYETSAVAQPGFFSAKNAQMIRLYQNLSPHGLIRIGGNVSDHSQFIPDGTPAAKTEREVTIINRACLNDLGDFARATGWRVMWGLNLGTGTKEEAADEAVAVDHALGGSLQSFEIGNEVDLMRKYAKDFEAYHAAYLDYKAPIRARLPHAVFSGPDVAGSFAFVEKFVAAESSDMALVTHHYYRGGARDPKSTIEQLLTRDTAFDSRLQQLHSLCQAPQLNYRINEVNSFFGGGKEGVSDTFASALWCLDYLFTLASRGCAGANLETDINQLGFISHYSPIVHDASGVCSARPEYYGMLAFAMAGRGELLSTRIEKDERNLTAYATRDAGGAIYLTVINKELSEDATIECPLPSGYSTAESFSLRAQSPNSKTGVTFAGSAVRQDGSWTPRRGDDVPIENGSVQVAVPHAAAVVFRFTRG